MDLLALQQEPAAHPHVPASVAEHQRLDHQRVARLKQLVEELQRARQHARILVVEERAERRYHRIVRQELQHLGAFRFIGVLLKKIRDLVLIGMYRNVILQI